MYTIEYHQKTGTRTITGSHIEYIDKNFIRLLLDKKTGYGQFLHINNIISITINPRLKQ